MENPDSVKFSFDPRLKIIVFWCLLCVLILLKKGFCIIFGSVAFFSLVTPRCRNTDDRWRPYRRSSSLESLLCVALTLNPVSIHQSLLIAAGTSSSTEARGDRDYTWKAAGGLIIPLHSCSEVYARMCCD